jgi:hypothetical protein
MLRTDHFTSQGPLPGMWQVAQTSLKILNPNDVILNSTTGWQVTFPTPNRAANHSMCVQQSMQPLGVTRFCYSKRPIVSSLTGALPFFELRIIPTRAEAAPSATVTSIGEGSISQVCKCEQNFASLDGRIHAVAPITEMATSTLPERKSI